MTQSDPRKRAEWLKRLEGYEASGLTVNQFCRQYDVSPHTFYYWRKRLRQTVDSGPRKVAQNGGGRREDALRSGMTDDADTTAVVHFIWGSTLRISIPAHCMDAIRCVLDCAHRAEDIPANAVRTFQEVVLAQ